ncbi:hypothetical protein SK128_017775, partial [Halocaridina rubra]
MNPRGPLRRAPRTHKEITNWGQIQNASPTGDPSEEPLGPSQKSTKDSQRSREG